jgi:uncharacterized protein
MLKTLPVQIKTVDSAEGGAGIVEALVATYDVDSIGDRIVPGAFAKSLEEWAQSGTQIPFIWSHMHDDLDAYLGDVIEAKETDDGLWVRAQLDMEDDKSRKAFKLIKGGRVRNYSFAYEVIDAGPDEDGPGETALRELKLFEVGPTLIGMNRNTRTIDAKRNDAVAVLSASDWSSLQLKVGRVLSASNETTLRDAYDAIGRVLAQIEAQSSDDEGASSNTAQGKSAQPATTAKVDERASEKTDEPNPTGPADDDLLLELSLLMERG